MDYFEDECRRILEDNYQGSGFEEAKQQLAWELEVIRRYRESSIFVIGREITERLENGYWMGGRLAASIVAYLFGITHVDPIGNHLCKEAVWDLEGNRVPQLIFHEVGKKEVKRIESYLQNRDGVGDVIKIESEEMIRLYLVPAGCDCKAYREMEERALETALGSIVFLWNQDGGETQTTFEDEFMRLISGGLDRREAFSMALSRAKANGYRFKADCMEEQYYKERRKNEETEKGCFSDN